PLGFVMPAQTSWRLVQNDVGPARFALHGVPVPVRTYTYTRIVDRVAVATTAYVFWFRTPIADGRELAARFELSVDFARNARVRETVRPARETWSAEAGGGSISGCARSRPPFPHGSRR